MNPFEHPLLQQIPAELRKSIGLAQVRFEPGDVLYAAGSRVELVHFIAAGTVEAIHRDTGLGIRSVIDTVGAGEVVGGSVQVPATSRFEVRAVEQTTSFGLPVDDFAALVRTCAAFAGAMWRHDQSRFALLEDRVAALSRVDITRVVLDPVLLDRVTAQYILSKRVIPVALQGGTVTIACAARDTAGVEADMRRLLQAARVVLFRISDKEFERVYRESVQPQLQAGGPREDEHAWYRGVKDKQFLVEYATNLELPTDGSRKDVALDGKNVVTLTNRILGEAVDLGSSDIHFEPYPAGMEVRFRMDGELVRRPDRVGAGYLAAVVSRIKVLAGMDIAEKRKPQDGRITATVGSKTVDIRVSTVPTRFGEKVVLRILDPTTMLMDLETLIESHEVYRAVTWMVQQPYGMILIAGPTGAGKTTTVYSMLLNRKQLPVNIMTIEDPIEYSLPGVTQVQRNLHVNLDFPNAVRSFLRQDPDVIVVGETRDSETARAALEAGLTGHLVISTIHANNVFGTIFRLKEMEMEPFVIANSVIGVVSQRLVRRICPKCARTHQYHRNLIEPLGLTGIGERAGDFYHFRKGTGCLHCNYKGYRGRAAVFESLRIAEALKPLLAAQTSFAEMEAAALAQGAYVPMSRYAAQLLTSGVTTPEEVSRVLFTQERQGTPDAEVS